MSEINGIYAASVSILDRNLRLDISKTIKHAENLIDQGCHGVAIPVSYTHLTLPTKRIV